MQPTVSLVVQDAYKHNNVVVPLLFVVLASTASVCEPVQHSLLVAAASWASIWAYTAFKAGIWSSTSSKTLRTSRLAGACLALSSICDGAARDKQGTWATKAMLPLLAFLISNNDVLPRLAALPTHSAHTDDDRDSKTSSEQHAHMSSFRVLAVVTVTAAIALGTYSVPTTSVLGMSSVIFAAAGLVLLERAARGTEDETENASYRSVSAGPPQAGPSPIHSPSRQQFLAVLRDLAAVLTLACGLSSIFLEPSIIGAVPSQSVDPKYGRDWRTAYESTILRRFFGTIFLRNFTNTLMYIMIVQHSALNTSLMTLASCILAKLYFSFTFTTLWFSIVFASSAALFTIGSLTSASLLDTRSSARNFKRIVFGVSALSIGLLLFQYASRVHHPKSPGTSPTLPIMPPPSPFKPIPLDLAKGHPAAQLVDKAEREFQNVVSRQSSSLGSAVQEYRRRYGIVPPPNFDKWYEFAVRNEVVMIDEYDTVHEMLLPFWALKPATIRSRISRELGGEDSALIGVAIRNGAIANIEKGDEWQRKATASMMEKFIQYLPDMDLGFNIHDEPRVVVSDGILAAIVKEARSNVLPRVAKTTSSRNAFSARPADLNDGKRFVETYVSNFNRFAHQQTWIQSRLSCPMDSQAQTYEDYAADNLTAYAAGPLQYIYNTTAFSDVCLSPSLSSTFGFFERPNAFNIIHELVPIFSQSKISSFQDILYPSPWYWAGKVVHDEKRDTSWENKTNALYWRGSTTGGFSRNGGWRRQHRQHVVQRLNAPDKAQLVDTESQSVIEVDRRSRKHLIDVHFSHIGQCDPGDCDAQKEFFHVTERVDGQDAWYFKHLLDMDGNAFSGRFYSFLKSRSLTYKMAIFREWHAEWLKPWVHYIPLSLRGDEHLDLVQWFGGDKSEGKESTKGGNGDSEGERKAREIAERSTMWHDKVLRKVDFEAWFFRLLLEYGRIVDDNREEIGYLG
ncbi:hypothetical protein DE146DRAFT_757793 [Phaeosphaeria sp. MPI-PUGE-AT-0046c]|nr:hypothetical protein DE146DRAFT_757793 [Phaeosphaeria sp. MPI-PUGE-AT-0046c]